MTPLCVFCASDLGYHCAGFHESQLTFLICDRSGLKTDYPARSKFRIETKYIFGRKVSIRCASEKLQQENLLATKKLLSEFINSSVNFLA